MYKRYTQINYWEDCTTNSTVVHVKSLLENNTAHFIILSVECICFARDLHHFVLCFA